MVFWRLGFKVYYYCHRRKHIGGVSMFRIQGSRGILEENIHSVNRRLWWTWKMVLITAPVPKVPTHHIFFNESVDLRNKNPRNLPSPNHQLELRSPLRHPIQKFPNHTSPQPLNPQTTTFTKKKKKRKGPQPLTYCTWWKLYPFPHPLDMKQVKK